MKISGKKPAVGTDTYVKKAGGGENDAVKKQEGGARPSSGDSVDISVKGRDLNRAKGMVESTPDIRGEMVVRFKADIERGAYNVDAGKVAEKMIERALRNALHVKK